jgi:hypothetical protein
MAYNTFELHNTFFNVVNSLDSALPAARATLTEKNENQQVKPGF